MIEGNERNPRQRHDAKTAPKRRPGVDPRRLQPQQPREGLGKLLASVLLVVVVIGGSIVAATMLRKSRPDPHYVSATTMIEKYERGKSVDRRNYGHSVYQTALEELAKVDPKSVSFADAKQLEREITARIVAFRKQLRNQEQEHQQAIEARIERRAIEYQERLRVRDLPPYYPECELEKGGHAGHDHKH